MNFDLESITEPHDFINEELVALDTTIRCGICKDIINIPMIAPCLHSFCSMCIRESLSVKAECPVCRTATSDGQLKRNTMLSEISEAYKKARSTLLRLEKTSNQQYDGVILGKRKRSDSSGLGANVSKVPKIQNSAGNGSVLNRRHQSDRSSSRKKGKFLITKTTMVSCPACEEFLDPEFINEHLDSNCTLNQQDMEVQKGKRDTIDQKKAWASVLTSRPKPKIKDGDEIPTKRISKVNYDIKSTKQLRELLSDIGLSDKGDASHMRQRHERWVNLWNAEVDAKKPRTKAELLMEMSDWEQARSRAKAAPKVDSSKDWLENNRAQFDQLVSNVRLKVKDVSIASKGVLKEHDDETLSIPSSE
ncbi:hypothetical protein CPB86DRAFT_729739, partial [Serendipita vermifera]